MATTLAEHPTVKRFYEQEHVSSSGRTAEPVRLSSAWLRQLALDCGADDVGFVEMERAEVADQRAEIDTLLPGARTLISLIVRTNREDIRTPMRSVANLEFHESIDTIDVIAQHIVAALEAKGIRALNPPAGFPMEMDRWTNGKIWIVSHKPVAVAAGLGRMGIHRNVIHPKFGNFISLGTVVTDAIVDAYSAPIDYNPCLECKLCVAACPTGAIHSDGHFDFAACYTHNYREFMGGFSDWVETVASSGSALAYREKVTDAETVSMWQSLAFGPNYKAAYCMAVCPAGDDVIGPFLVDRKQFLQDVVKPLQDKPEPVYVVANSDAEAYVTRRFPAKRVRRVSNGLRPGSIRALLRTLPIAFQRERAGDLQATYHFTFTGEEALKATIVIRDKTIRVESGHVGTADLRLTADSRSWLRFVRKEASLVWALLRRRIRLQGSPRLLLAFGRCFPS